ncbi:sulfatase family protein [Singulisphaera acidiphila]|uniref:Arylsulfatase A family protein n=1 Tax=Singulisphaera acidiphila (strain ATCC BAA-1392 / DSM 18658 / VKM B-2454 / MOB10) TaxID=886293 RepID=L0DPK1_SINAD|nr:arylsulfatase [Singulisphaera acidiphila]AGA31172.1 arylsulfatase A family protein [Singulisphaera acidiphila DSM 18658]
MRSRFSTATALVLALWGTTVSGADDVSPNIVVIYADDLGYGDLGCYGATQVKTPNLDRLAARGLRFTDAHASAATCTPSRYALLTGEYAWRQKGTNILPGDASLIIKPGRITVPAMLKQAGYTTGCVGKWHLGLGEGPIDWNSEIRPGPLEVGFDSSFILPATGDRVPCVYVKDRRVVGLDPKDPIRVDYLQPVGDDPTGRLNPDQLKIKLSHGHDNTIVNGISRIGYMAGGKAARWVDEDMADVLTREATAFIDRNQAHPFFLYFATHDVHVPRVPHPRFAGKSGCGVRGDVIEELDWCVGEVLATLDRLKLADNTLVLFSSDNGPVVDDGYADDAEPMLNGHRPAGPLRGGKYSPYEGGTRVPLIACWPAKIKPGISDALICQIDLLATFAALTKRNLPQEAGPDSFDVLPALLGTSPVGRDHLVEQGGGLSLRQGKWKLISRQANGQGGPVATKKAAVAKKKKNGPSASAVELFDLAVDPAETNNLASSHLEEVEQLSRLLERIRQEGRSRLVH